MAARSRLLLGILIGALIVAVVVVPVAHGQGKKVPRVTGLSAAGSNLASAKLAVRWKKVRGASYQVRWASTSSGLAGAKRYATRATSAVSPSLGDVCSPYYVQVRAKKRAKYGRWSVPRVLRFAEVSGVKPATPIISGQTSSSAVEVRWAKKSGATGYRVRYSPAPYGNWPGYFPYTATTPSTSSGLSIPLPDVGAGDRFMGAAYGNPLFGQLETKRCSGTYGKSPFFAAFPKPLPPGNASTGTPVRFGSYNVEKYPQSGSPKIPALAGAIADAALDVIALQEADAGTADALRTRLRSSEGQSDWESYSEAQQVVMWRTSEWERVSAQDIGKPVDSGANAARTPLPTPAVQLTPAAPNPSRQDIFVASVHLEDRLKFDSGATNAEQKNDAHLAALSLIAAMATANPTDVPTLVAGDLKGNFGGGGRPATAGYCDESSTPKCVGEGQPTFIRNGFLDARGAVTKIGIEYATVNGHNFPQVGTNSGIGSRADYIVVRGFTGISRYVNQANLSNRDSPSDHNLIYADLFVPFGP